MGLGYTSTCPFLVKGVIPREKASQTWDKVTYCWTPPLEGHSEGTLSECRGEWEDGKLRKGWGIWVGRGFGKGQKEGMRKLGQDIRKKGCFQSLSLLLSVPRK